MPVPMKTKLLRFVLVSVIMIIMGILVLSLFDLFEGTVRQNLRENMRSSVIIGVMTAAVMVFFTKFFPDSKS